MYKGDEVVDHLVSLMSVALGMGRQVCQDSREDWTVCLHL
jgi:hypothetical protein